MKKLIEHLFHEDAGSFLDPNPSQYTAGEIVADVLATPFHLCSSLTAWMNRPKPPKTAKPPKPSRVKQQPRVPEPTKEDMHAAAMMLRDDNKRRILASNMPPDMEAAYLQREDDLFAETLQNILDQA